MDFASLRSRIEARIQGVLASRGIEVHRTASGVRRTLPGVLAHYKQLGLDPTTVIDVGVGAGTPGLYQAFPDARLVLVEPVVEWRRHLENLSRRGQTDLVMSAAGSRTGEAEIAVHRVPHLSSILGGRDDAVDVAWRTVPMVTLDALVPELHLSAPFVLKVDVEGGEREVLSGALDVLPGCELVLVEVSLFELLEGAPLLHDVVFWMHDHGFVVGDLYDGHNRPLDGSLAQLDVAFVQTTGRFRTRRAYATPAQADRLYRTWGA